MIGGKWTTFRSFGEMAADMALERLGRQRQVATTDRPIGGGRAFPKNAPVWLGQAAAQNGLSGANMAELFSRYGTVVSKTQPPNQMQLILPCIQIETGQ